MINKRLRIALATGAILGLFCIAGISIRLGFAGNELFIAATWINRVVMGLVIGLVPYYKSKKSTTYIVFRGAVLGLLISGSFYLATSFRDTPGFIAGIVYGVIIDLIATRYE